MSFKYKTFILNNNIVKKSIVKENRENRNGVKIPEGCFDIPIWGWDWISAAQKLTEAKIIGISINAIMPIIAHINANLCLYMPMLRKTKYQTYIRNKTNVVINRGSQTQGWPHIGVAHMGPVINTKPVNKVPISADACPMRSYFKSLKKRYDIPETITKK